MGTVFKQPGATTVAPTPTPPPSSYVDEINGVEQVPVKNDDGSVTYITRKIPLSKEDQLKKSHLDKMADDALAEIKRISSSDYVYSESTKGLLEDWQAGQLESLGESFDSRKELESDSLAKRGLSDSTAGNTINRQTKQDEYDAKKNIEREKSSIGQSIKSSELASQYNMYNLAQNQLNYDAAMVQKGVDKDLTAVRAINATNTASLNDYYTQKMSGAVGQNMFINNILDPLSKQAGETSSGVFDSAVGGFVSTITGGLV